MFPLVKSHYDLVLMRLPPQAFPVSTLLLAINALSFSMIVFASHWLLSDAIGFSLGRAALSVVNVAAGAALVLLVARRSVRWTQTVTALYGGSALLGAMLFPVLLAYMLGIQNIFIQLSVLAFNIWELLFFAHVYRNALDTGMGAGIAVALIYLLASMMVKQMLLPFPEGSA